jgi:hypothetical protein
VEAFLLVPEATPRPLIVIVIDNYDDSCDELARPMERLARLVRGREDCGLHFVVASREQIHGDGFCNQVRAAQNAIALRNPEILRELGDAEFMLSAGKQKMRIGRGYLVRQGRTELVQGAVPFDLAAIGDTDAKRVVASALDQWIERISAAWPGPCSPIPGFSETATVDEQPAPSPAEADAAPRSTSSALPYAEVLPDALGLGADHERFATPSLDEPHAPSVEPVGLSMLSRLRLLLGYLTMELLHRRSLADEEISQLFSDIFAAWGDPPMLLQVLRSLAPRIIPGVQVEELPAEELIALLHEELHHYVVVDPQVQTDELAENAEAQA